MTGSKFLLDSNIVIDVFNKKVEVLDRVKQLESCFISTVIVGELYVGVNRVLNKDKHLTLLDNLLKTVFLIDITQSTAKVYGEIMATLLNKGKPIPINDVWIAASAIDNKLTLITKDKHFREVEGLDVEFW